MGSAEEANKAAAKAFFAAVDAVDRKAVFELLDAEYRMTMPGTGAVVGRDEHWRFIETMKGAMDDMTHTAEIVAAEGEYVFTQGRASGTHTGPLAGHAATGRKSDARFINVLRFREGRIVELFSLMDNVTLGLQLGFDPL
ncbi:ester cyclase [Nonomuraea jabiensis]|uniref:ester cyclase n=1 Tax=Nonomuraea jabiensis TaxID=882448 RepID=UPI003449F464